MTDSMDFKYIIQDLSNYYIGARMTYEELIGHEDMPAGSEALCSDI